MLHAKFQDHRTSGSGRGGHLGHEAWTICINFLFPYPRRLQIKFGFGLA